MLHSKRLPKAIDVRIAISVDDVSIRHTCNIFYFEYFEG